MDQVLQKQRDFCILQTLRHLKFTTSVYDRSVTYTYLLYSLFYIYGIIFRYFLKKSKLSLPTLYRCELMSHYIF